MFSNLNKVILFLILAIVFSTILLSLDYLLKIDYKDIIVEAHGLLMDIILFGIIITLYETLKSKKERIHNLEEQLEDFRQWEEPEATYRIIGIFKRLKQLKVPSVDLSYCYLKNAYFDSKFDMKSVNFSHARMQHSRLIDLDISNGELVGTNLEIATLSKVNLNNSNLETACLNNARLLRNVNFSNANLKRAGLIDIVFGESINLTNVELHDALVNQNFFERLENSQVIGREEIIKNYKIVRIGNDEKFSFRLKKESE
jgi:hypothetical protein